MFVPSDVRRQGDVASQGGEMAHLFMRDDDNARRLVATGYVDHTLRGFLIDDGDKIVTVTVEWGPSRDGGKHHTPCFSARLWPGGATLANVVRPWRRSGDWHAAWNELRRQVRDVSGVDIGDPPHNSGTTGASASADVS